MLCLNNNSRPEIEEVLNDEWMLRYLTFDSPNSSFSNIRFSTECSSPILSPVSCPGRESTFRILSPNFETREYSDSNSNRDSFAGRGKFFEFNTIDGWKGKKRREGKRNRKIKQPKTFLEKFLSSFGVS
jgi:hypothetical protein